MGNRRLGRKRLYALEKKGESLTAGDLGMGAGAAPMLVHAHRSREGSEIITEIVLNLAPSGTDIKPGDSQANGAIGVDGSPAEIAVWTRARFGYITGFEMVFIEAVDNATTNFETNLSVKQNAASIDGGDEVSATDVFDIASGALGIVEGVAISLGSAFDTTKPYLYLTADAAAAATKYAAGKIVLRITGIDDPTA